MEVLHLYVLIKTQGHLMMQSDASSMRWSTGQCATAMEMLLAQTSHAL